MNKVAGAQEGFDRRIEEVTSGFEGALAIVAANGIHLKRPTPAAFNILLPVSGSAVSRRGAEVAIALARASTSPLRVVYVSTTRDNRRDGPSMSRGREEAILKDIGALAARYGVEVTTKLRASTAPQQAILQEIAASGADLVVMGSDRIPGAALNFGSVAAEVLRKSKVSVLLVSDGEKRNGGSRSAP
jgi:nucleotide-binding universal stress UspA family protein